MRRSLFFVLLLLPAPLAAQSADEKKATITFLAGLQQPDGGFVAAPIDPRVDAIPRSSLRATSAAARAIRALGGEVPNQAKAARFVQSCYDKESGGFADTPKGEPDVTATAVGMMAAAELYPTAFDPVPCNRYLVTNAKTFEERRLAVAGMEAGKAFPVVINEWFAEVEKGRNPDGTYGKGDGQARETGGVAAMNLRSGGTLSDEHRKAAVAALKAGQRADGGFSKADAKGSDLETTYRVMRAFHLLREKPKDEAKLKEFIGKCRNKDGGYGVSPGQPSQVSGTYYASMIGKWLES